MASPHVIEVSEADFDQEIVRAATPALVDFWGPACGPCKALEPVIEQLAANYQGRLKVAKVNVDASAQIAIRFAVRSLPTLLLFKGGKVVDQITGRVSLSAIEKAIRRTLA